MQAASFMLPSMNRLAQALQLSWWHAPQPINFLVDLLYASQHIGHSLESVDISVGGCNQAHSFNGWN
jgi:hypothetical protein